MITLLPMMAVLPILAILGLMPLRKIIIEDKRIDENSSVFKLPRLENLKPRHSMDINISGTEDELHELDKLKIYGYKEYINVKVLDEKSIPLEI
jgi:hypothetical protein